MSVGVLLMIVSFVLFVLATIGVASPPRFNWLAAGLACWALAVLIGGLNI